MNESGVMFCFFAGTVVTVLQCIPPFTTYHGLYEFSQYAFGAVYADIKGMQWSDLKDNKNKLQTSLIILAVEAIVFMLLALYLDQVVSSDNGINKHPLFFLNFKRKGAKPEAALTTARSRRFSGSSRAMAYMNAEDAKAIDRPDVAREVSSLFPWLYSSKMISSLRTYSVRDHLSSHCVRTITERTSRGAGCSSQQGVSNSV